MKLSRLILSLITVSLALSAQQAPQAQVLPQAPVGQSRLLCMFFDLNSLDAAAQSKALDTAAKFIQEQVTPSDRVAVMTYTSQLNVLQDFTDNHDSILAALRTIMPGNRGASAGTQLQGLQAAISVLGQLPEKKAMIYYSSGVPKDAAGNQNELQTTVNAALRANVSIYPSDSRGTQ